MNKITVVGRLGADAELRHTPNDKAVCQIRIACDVGFGERKKTEWFSGSIWGKRGEALVDYLTKGTPVTVIGELTHRTWEGNDGTTRVSLEINVDEIAMQGKGEKKEEPTPVKTTEPLDDEIPF